jgi:hypothetical protein
MAYGMSMMQTPVSQVRVFRIFDDLSWVKFAVDLALGAFRLLMNSARKVNPEVKKKHSNKKNSRETSSTFKHNNYQTEQTV